ncbi:MAG: glycogen/starch synthase [Paludibacteraceae bacterium]|nr:glycogen/starch synthase [Paludibacteraceae bacterium]
MKQENYIFETSWEVCNRVGGIYTVLSSVAESLGKVFGDRVVFIGPDFNINNHPVFVEDTSLLADWRKQAAKDGLLVKVGRWAVPGKPIAVLVDFKALWGEKDAVLYHLWADFSIDSLGTGEDYANSIMFGYAAAKVVEHFANYFDINKSQSVAQFHEWMTASGLLYLKRVKLGIKTVFTTHATTVGRSICFNGKQLYQYFDNYNGDQMAYELGVKAQHAVEKQGALRADCFTTVSKFTARECKQLLGKAPDVVTPNGFEGDFVPKGAQYEAAREQARAELCSVTETLLGYKIDEDALYVGISGRMEFRNKGIDVFIETLQRLNQNLDLKRQIVAFIMIPDWINGPRKDLQDKLAHPKQKFQFADIRTTHELHQPQYDAILQALNNFQLQNNDKDKVKVVFIPSYLDGHDGIFNKEYYDLLIGLDMTVFPSYYEPWGYTPMESAAFGVPTITTDLAGFGLWVSEGTESIENGVAVLHRDDANRNEVIDNIRNEVLRFAQLTPAQAEKCRAKAAAIAQKGSWQNFVKYYLEAFSFATGSDITKISAAVASVNEVATKPAAKKTVAAKPAAAKKPAAKKTTVGSVAKTATKSKKQ